MSVLAVIEHDRGTIASASLGVLTAARNLAAQMNTTLEAVTVGANADALATVAAQYGATVVHQAHHNALTDFGPEAWGESVAQVVRKISPQVVIGTGTERGHEVVAQVAARLDLPASMNCMEFDSAFTGAQPLKVVRARWGGSLLEQSEVDAPIKLVTLANHTVDPSESPASASNIVHDVELNDSVMHSFVQDRVERRACWVARRNRRLFARGYEQRLAKPHRPGGPNRHPHCSRHLYCLRYFRSHSALGRRNGIKKHPCHQHRQGSQHRHQGWLRRNWRPAQDRACNIGRNSPPTRVNLFHNCFIALCNMANIERGL